MKKNLDIHSYLNWLLGSVLSLSLLLTACGDKSKRGLGQGNGQGIAGTCTGGVSSLGIVYDSGSGQFQNQVAAYLSSWMDPRNLGAVDGNPNAANGVVLRGKLKYNAQGQLIREQSQLELTINDSLSIQGGEAISPINYQQGVGGSMNVTTRTFDATFQDQYGRVAITDAHFDDKYAWGTIQFQNSQAVTGYSAQTGTLGSFKIMKCGLLD
jgi:hypothetical protein